MQRVFCQQQCDRVAGHPWIDQWSHFRLEHTIFSVAMCTCGRFFFFLKLPRYVYTCLNHTDFNSISLILINQAHSTLVIKYKWKWLKNVCVISAGMHEVMDCSSFLNAMKNLEHTSCYLTAGRDTLLFLPTSSADAFLSYFLWSNWDEPVQVLSDSMHDCFAVSLKTDSYFTGLLILSSFLLNQCNFFLI